MKVMSRNLVLLSIVGVSHSQQVSSFAVSDLIIE